MPEGMVIEIDDDGDNLTVDSNERGRPRGEAALKDGKNDAGFSDLKAQLDEARDRADKEKRRADEASGQAARDRQDADRARSDAQTARRESRAGQKTAIDSAIAANKSSLDAIEADMVAAMDAGDFKRHAALNRRMHEITSDLARLQDGQVALKEDGTDEGDKPNGSRAEPTRDARKTQTDEERFEAYVSQFSPSVQEWIRAHPEVATNTGKNHRAIAAHYEAIEKGYAQDSDAYFAHLDRSMGYRSGAAARAVARDNPIEPEDRQNRETRSAPVRSAPARGSNGGGGHRTSVELTPGEVLNSQDGTIVWNLGQYDRRGRMITKDDPRLGEPIGPEEFAYRKKKMNEEGRYIIPTL